MKKKDVVILNARIKNAFSEMKHVMGSTIAETSVMKKIAKVRLSDYISLRQHDNTEVKSKRNCRRKNIFDQ